MTRSMPNHGGGTANVGWPPRHGWGDPQPSGSLAKSGQLRKGMLSLSSTFGMRAGARVRLGSSRVSNRSAPQLGGSPGGANLRGNVLGVGHRGKGTLRNSTSAPVESVSDGRLKDHVTVLEM